MFNLFIKKKYLVRHKILKTLQNQLAEFYTDHVDVPDSMITLAEITKQSKLSEKEIIANIDYLNQREHIYIEWIQENAYYLVSPKGTVAYFDRQYLIDGRESTFKKTKEIVLFSLAITTLIVTIFTFLSNVLLTKKNNEEIKVLQKEMKIFSNRSKPES